MTQRTDRVRRVSLWVAAALTLWATWQVSQDDDSETIGAQPSKRVGAPVAKVAKAVTELPVISWPVRGASSESSGNPVPTDGHVGDLFALPAPPVERLPSPPPERVAPPPPPWVWRIVGEYHDGTRWRYFLADSQDRLATVGAVGDVVDGDWELIAIEDRLLQFRHRSTGFLHTVSLDQVL